jgi:membrane protein
MTFVFSFLFKFLPEEKRPKFKEVIFGSIITSVFFIIGQIVIAVYFKIIDIGSVFGALGGLIVLLVWLYYSSAVFFFGAEYTHLSIKINENKQKSK